MDLPPKVRALCCLLAAWQLLGSQPSLAQQSVIVHYGDNWRTLIPANDPGTAWRNVNFNDQIPLAGSNWGHGIGLFGFESAPLPAPGIQTPLGSSGSTPMVYLFRKVFEFYGDPTGATFSLDQIVDDGVAYYLNGHLLGVSRFTPGGMWNASSSGSVGDAVEELNVLSGNLPGLVFGTNVLAAEVHQAGPNNSDMVFGARLKVGSSPLDGEKWRTLHFGSSSNSGDGADLADPDGDGHVNIQEYALCTHPKKPDTWGKLENSGAGLSATYQRRKAALNEVNITGVWAPGLGGPWSSSGVSEQILSDDGLIQLVRLTVQGGASQKFLKIQVVRPALQPVTSVPSGLQATASGTTRIQLAWIDNSPNESGFKIERRQSGTAAFIQIAQVSANVTSFLNDGLTAGTKYYFRVRGTNAAGDSAYSPEANATTDSGIPATPGNLSATAVSSSQIQLNWSDNSNNETGFEIERRQSGTSNFTLIATPAAGVTSYLDTGLLPGTKYYYHIRAISSHGSSPVTADVSATTPDTIPAAPTNVVAEVISSSRVNIQWVDNATNETGFKIERRQSGTPSFAEIATVGAGVLAYQDSGLSALTKYYYRVRAYNAAGNSSFSNEVPATTLGVPPAAPSNLTVVVISSSQINLLWSDNASDETSYELHRKTGSGGTYSLIATMGANVTSFQNQSLSPSTTYYYRIRALNAAGPSAFTNENYGTTPPEGGTPVTPVIMVQGYKNLLDLQITGSSKNWVINDISTRAVPDGYRWWYFVGGEIIKTQSNLTNYSWRGNHPGRVLKMAAKIGLESFATWDPTVGNYDSAAGYFFERGDAGTFATFIFR